MEGGRDGGMEGGVVAIGGVSRIQHEMSDSLAQHGHTCTAVCAHYGTV